MSKQVIFIMLFFINLVQAMEKKYDIDPVIVDYNNNESLEQKPSIVGVFGGTIRYSAYEDYTNSLQNHYIALVAQYNKNKRLKGVENSIKNIISSLAKDPGLDKTKNCITQSSNAERLKLFFAMGFEHDTLQENIATLLKTTKEKCSEQEKFALRSSEDNQHDPIILAHVLLPSYFADLPHLHGKDETPEHIYSFLKESAVFFKKLYQSNPITSSLKICIIIPHLRHFMSLIESPKMLSNAEGNPIELLEANSAALYETLMEPLGCQKYLFFDQDVRDGEPMINFFAEKGVERERISCIRIPITNQMGFPSTIFLPYVLKRGKRYSYQTSPLLTKKLESYLKEKTKENNE